MEQEIKAIQSEILNIQQDRMRIINENEARFKKLENALKELEHSSDAQIKINQLFNQQIIALETETTSLQKQIEAIRISYQPIIQVQPKAEIKIDTNPIVNLLKRLFK